MKRIFTLSILLLSLITLINAQDTIQIRYIKSEAGGRPVPQKKAKYIEIKILEADSIVRIELKDLKSDDLYLLKRFKNDTPVGVWILPNGKTVDFDVLQYRNSEYTDVIKYDIKENGVIGDIDGQFEAPVFPENGGSFQWFIARNLRYPAYAQENRIQGKVMSQVVIDENGELKNLSILQSAHKILDMEASRVILLSPKWTPAKLNGKPIKVFIIVPTNFVLQ